MTTIIFGGTAALFPAMTLAVLWHLRWVRRLPALETFTTAAPSTVPGEGRVRCSVVIAARDEEARIEETIRHLLAQRGVEAEFIVVDDRSTDRTGAILRRLAKEDARLRVQRVEVLPEGWPCALLMPFMFPVFLYALLNSTFVTLRQGGIRWRDTFYALDTLRAGNVR